MAQAANAPQSDLDVVNTRSRAALGLEDRTADRVAYFAPDSYRQVPQEQKRADERGEDDAKLAELKEVCRRHVTP